MTLLSAKNSLVLATTAVMALALAGCNKAEQNKAEGGASQPAATTSQKTLDKIKKRT